VTVFDVDASYFDAGVGFGDDFYVFARVPDGNGGETGGLYRLDEASGSLIFVKDFDGPERDDYAFPVTEIDGTLFVTADSDGDGRLELWQSRTPELAESWTLVSDPGVNVTFNGRALAVDGDYIRGNQSGLTLGVTAETDMEIWSFDENSFSLFADFRGVDGYSNIVDSIEAGGELYVIGLSTSHAPEPDPWADPWEEPPEPEPQQYWLSRIGPEGVTEMLRGTSPILSLEALFDNVYFVDRANQSVIQVIDTATEAISTLTPPPGFAVNSLDTAGGDLLAFAAFAGAGADVARYDTASGSWTTYALPENLSMNSSGLGAAGDYYFVNASGANNRN
jgi:hypothetical protein